MFSFVDLYLGRPIFKTYTHSFCAKVPSLYHPLQTFSSWLKFIFFTACRLHISLHGCLQGKEEVDTRFAEMTGYNDAGAANDVIILYPQVKTNWLLNPKGCFDW